MAKKLTEIKSVIGVVSRPRATGAATIPLRGENGKSAYEIACEHGFEGSESEWVEYISNPPADGSVTLAKLSEALQTELEKLHTHENKSVLDSVTADDVAAWNRATIPSVGIYAWYTDTDDVQDASGVSFGTLSDCMTDDFTGTWFYVRTTASETGEATYPSKYKINGANGYLSLGDYVIWTGSHLVHVSTYEAKASTAKNSDGKYSPKSGVDGLMSSTDKAYLTDLIDAYWGVEKLPIYTAPDPEEGWQCNWLRDTGWYLGGIKKGCGGHPPVLNDNHTSWAILTLNGMATDADSLNHNHRLQIAFDVVNSKLYMRRGWMSANTWADEWTEAGGSTADIATNDEVLEMLTSVFG